MEEATEAAVVEVEAVVLQPWKVVLFSAIKPMTGQVHCILHRGLPVWVRLPSSIACFMIMREAMAGPSST